MPEKNLNIYQKLAKIRKVVEVVQKNKTGYGYKYVSDDELLAKITGAMDKYEVSLIPSIAPMTFYVDTYTYTKINKKEKEEIVNEIIVRADMIYKWVDNDNPENVVEVPWALVGNQSDASQSFGSALTYSYRYFLLKYFGVATPEDDPDAWKAKKKQAEDEEDKLITEQIISEYDKAVREYIADHNDDDSKKKVKDLTSKYVKSGDYTKIKEPHLAAKMLEDFYNTFLAVEETSGN